MLVSWTSPFIFWTKVKEHEEIKKELKEKILKESENFKYYNSPLKERKISANKWNCEVITSYFHREDVKKFFTEKIITSIIENPLDELFEDKHLFPNKPGNITISEIWFNVYKPGYSQELHAHSGSSLSGIYLLELNEPNTTMFFNNNSGYKYKICDVGSVFPTSHIEEGNIIFFPSELVHSVNKCVKDRITISFNLLFDYQTDLVPSSAGVSGIKS
jgi:uncharacterized protein (TIGR02466 family)